MQWCDVESDKLKQFTFPFLKCNDSGNMLFAKDLEKKFSMPLGGLN